MATATTDTSASRSLARPEANITGLTFTGSEAASKRIELLKEVVPRLDKLALIKRRGSDPVFDTAIENDVAKAAEKWGFTWQAFTAGKVEDYDGVFAQLEAEGFDAAYVGANPLTFISGTRIAGLGIQHRIATLGDIPRGEWLSPHARR